jgi:hypothetical protein
MQPGVKVSLTTIIRSAKTGMLLPKEGTLVSVTENLGRTLLLVVFEGGHFEYLFEDEVELKKGDSSRREFGTADRS